MAWIILVLALAAAGLTFAASRPVKIPREPDREGYQDAEASHAYDRMGRWPIFWFERYIITRGLAMIEPRGVLVDLGCGPGHVTRAVARRYPQLQVLALDNNEEMLAIARRSPGISPPQLVLGEVERLPFADGSIDCVISSLSLHHWSSADLAFREIKRVLRPGGQYFIFDLRRDAPRIVYLVFRVGQALLAPSAIKRTNGAVGSLYASYTVPELSAILAEVFEAPRIGFRFAWVLIRGTNDFKGH